MNYGVLLCFVFLILPGIYLAGIKYFLVILNEKYNIFLIRLLFTIPLGALITVISSVGPILFLHIIIGNHYSDYIYVASIILSSLCSILIFHKYLIRKDVPPEYDPDFINYDLYVYMPLLKIPCCKYNRSIFSPNARPEKKLFYGVQKDDLKLNFKDLKGKDIIFTDCGEIIANQTALSVICDHLNFSFETRPVKDNRSKPYELTEEYFQLSTKSVMLPIHPQTDKKEQSSKSYGIYNTSFKIYAVNGQFYYDKDVMANVSGFNVTTELLSAYTGYHFYPQKLWIVTNKTMRVLINELDQQKRDFIPIHLVDDKKEQ